MSRAFVAWSGMEGLYVAHDAAGRVVGSFADEAAARHAAGLVEPVKPNDVHPYEPRPAARGRRRWPLACLRWLST